MHALLGSLQAVWPEMALGGLFVVLLIIELVFQRWKASPAPWIAGLGLGAVIGLSAWQYSLVPAPHVFFLGLARNHQLSVFLKCLVGGAALLVVLLGCAQRAAYRRAGEFYALLVAVVLGLHLMVMTTHLLMLYLAVELVSLGSYALAYFAETRRSAAGSVRYLLFGGLSSGVMLYGISWTYGLTGTLDAADPVLWAALNAQPAGVASVAGGLVLGGLLFKVSAVPFHVWAPDVYHAAPLPVAAFFSVAPKLAGLAVLLVLGRLAQPHLPGLQVLLAVVALATITVGNFSALVQRNARRMLAYSSVAHAGFLLIGVAAGSAFAVQGFFYYAVVYACMNLAAFGLLGELERAAPGGGMEAFSGMGLRRPWLGVGVVVAMIGLAGLPPTAGFTAKLFVFSALWDAYARTGSQVLLVLFGWGLLNVAIALFYYLRLPYVLFFRKEAAPGSPPSVHWLAVCVITALLIPLLVLFFRPFLMVLNF